jgi:hypothetical protein
MKKHMSILFCFLLVFTPLAGFATGGNEGEQIMVETPYQINLKAAEFDPLLANPNIPGDLQYSFETGYYLVQFSGPIQKDWLEVILNLDCHILGYVPHYTYIIHMEKEVRKVLDQLSFVRWIGLYHPAYKIQEGLLSRQGPIQLNIMVFNEDPENFDLVRNNIIAIEGSIIREEKDSNLLVTEIDSSHIKTLAFIPEVEWMDEYSTPIAMMDNIRVFTGAESPLFENGFLGSGIVGEVKDNGIDQTHPEFEDQLIGTDGNINNESHGTSTFGIVFAKGIQNRALGMLPEGEGIFASWGVGRKPSIANLVNNWGGVFQSNSWSTGSADASYQSSSRQNDEAIIEYDVTMLYATGNGGDDGAISQDATAKNVISVGALSHYDNTDRTDDAHTGSQGNKGPTDDGRIKPDIVGPYDSIYTTTSGGGYTSSFGGTSGATPIVAGAVGLIYEMYRENHFGNNPAKTMPHAATVKAILIADAYQYEFSQGDRLAQGWGLADVGYVYDIGENHLIDNENNALKTGDNITYKITPTGITPLKISLVWTDVPSTTSSSMHLINDLGLKVTDPNGVVYNGNWGLEGSKWSLSDGEKDHVNNVENVFIEDPTPGEWTIEVTGDNIPLDGVIETSDFDQNYALVASGVEKQDHDLKVHAIESPQDVDVGQSVQIKGTVMNIGKNPETNVQISLAVDNITIDTKTISSIGVGEVEEVTFSWMPSEAMKYFISLRIAPEGGETSLGDNIKNIIIDASFVVGRILVDDGHGTEWRHHIYYHYIETMGPGKFRVSHTDSPITEENLTGYDIFISAWATESYTSEEESSIENFVDSGGGLLVIGQDTPGLYAGLTDYAGIDWGNAFAFLFTGDTTDVNTHEITENVNTLHFGSHELPLEVSPPAEEIAYTNDGIFYDRPALAVSEFGFGKVVAIADEELLSSEFIHEEDNRILGENIIRWLIDTGPIPIIDSPLSGSTYHATDMITFDGSSSYDPDGDTLSYLWNSNISGELGTSVSFTTTLDPGLHTISLEVSDSSGNSEVAQVLLTVQSPPQVSIGSPSDGSLVSGLVTITGSASDLDGTIVKVELRIGDSEWIEAQDTSGVGDWSSWSLDWDTTLSSDESHTILASAMDNEGLTSMMDSITLTVDNTPPIISGLFVSSQTDESATIEWDTDEFSDSSVEYWVEGSNDVSTKNDPSHVTHHSITLTQLTPSTRYYFRVESTDNVGNIGRSNVDDDFTTDDPPDTTAPFGLIVEPEDGETIIGEILIEVDASDDTKIDRVEFFIDNDLVFTDESSDYSWLWDTAGGQYPDGEYTIEIIVWDTSDNRAFHDISVFVDNEKVPPTIIREKATPGSIDLAESGDVLFTVKINDPEDGVELVEIDISSIGGSSHQRMYDDGTHGDEEADDHSYSYEASVSLETTEGDKTLEVTVNYFEGGTLNTEIELFVFRTEEPEVTDPEGGGGEEEGQPLVFWLLLMAIVILVVVALVGASSRRNRKRKQQTTSVPVAQTAYYQPQQVYYQDQYGQFRQQ